MGPSGRRSQLEIPDAILESVEQVVASYGLVEPSEPVIVALSGGKDSILLAALLPLLNIECIPVVIDMGYEAGWSDRVKATASAVGLRPQIVQARPRTAEPTSPTMLEIKTRIEILDRFTSRDINAGRTPCTHCYNVKALALTTAAEQFEVKKIAFAHHMTDAQASLLKEALMHIDRLDDGNTRFDRTRYERLVETLRGALTSSGRLAETAIGSRIEQLAFEGSVDSDEPPRQKLRRDASEIEIIRPLFLVFEHEISKLVAGSGIEPLGSGCGHGSTASTETPREMVHNRILRMHHNDAIEQDLQRAVLTGINADGTARVDARHRRGELLGTNYKPLTADMDKF